MHKTALRLSDLIRCTDVKHKSGIRLVLIECLLITVAAWAREPLIVRILSVPHCKREGRRRGRSAFGGKSMVVGRSAAAAWNDSWHIDAIRSNGRQRCGHGDWRCEVGCDTRQRIGVRRARNCGMDWRSVSRRRIAVWFDDGGCSARGAPSRLEFAPNNWCPHARVGDRVRFNNGHGGKDQAIKLLRPQRPFGVTVFGCRLIVSRSKQLGPH